MKLHEVCDVSIYEEIWVDDNDTVIEEDAIFEAIVDSYDGQPYESSDELFEAAKRAFRRVGQVIKKQFRCTSGPKKGKLAANPRACAQRKDPRKVRLGRKISRIRKGIRVRKTAITKRRSISKMVVRMNKRLG